MTQVRFGRASYLECLNSDLKRRRDIVNWCCRKVRKIKPDLIVVSGISGISMGSIVSFRTNVPLAIVRKENELAHCHSTFNVETGFSFLDNPEPRYLILDDGIASGRTVRRMFDAMCNVGSWLLGSYGWNEAWDFEGPLVPRPIGVLCYWEGGNPSEVPRDKEWRNAIPVFARC